MSVGNIIKSYNTDNGVYTAKDFTLELEKNSQTIHLSGVGTHHHNGVAESVIVKITQNALIMMFHTALHWPEQSTHILWPLAMSYFIHLHNHTPRLQDGLCPIKMWTRSKSNYSTLFNDHPWGCSVYVLDANLQDGHKIPH